MPRGDCTGTSLTLAICQPEPLSTVTDAMNITEQQLSEFGLTYGLGFFISYMLFIVWKLARDSNAGKFGTFVLFFALGLGILGFAAKYLIKWLMGI